MALHPQAAAVLAQMPPIWRDLDVLDTMTAARARAWMAGLRSGDGDGPRLPSNVAIERIEVPGAADMRPGRVYRPDVATPAGTIVWIAGGGFVLTSRGSELLLARLAAASGCVVVNVEYRLAPEHPFPAAPEDCHAALRWVTEHASALGGAARGVAVGGDSAGGNLTAVVALMARDRGGPQIALQLLLCPMTARTFDGGSRHDPEASPLGRPEALEWIWRQYLGDADGSDPLASPLDAKTLAGLPPAVVVTAEYDALRDEGEAYGARLAREGVPVDVRRYDGMHHGFAERPDAIDAGAECIDYMAAAFRRALAAS